jgi:indole-3-glycerol phosphate synthase
MVDEDEMSVQRLLQQFEHEIIGVNQKNISDIEVTLELRSCCELGRNFDLPCLVFKASARNESY